MSLHQDVIQSDSLEQFSKIKKITKFNCEFSDFFLEQEYFQFSKGRAVRDLRIAILALVLPLIAFSRTDYVLFGASSTFYFLFAGRLVAVFYSVWLGWYANSIKSHQTFNSLSRLFLVILLVITVIINITRSPTYFMFIPVDLACMLVIFMLIQSDWLGTTVLGSCFSLIAFFLILPEKEAVSGIMSQAIYMSYALVIFGGSLGARRMNQYRRAIYFELRQQIILQESLVQAKENIYQLENLLPICSYCKSIRDEDDHWHSMESYMSKRSDLSFSHGICPNCLPKFTNNPQEQGS